MKNFNHSHAKDNIYDIGRLRNSDNNRKPNDLLRFLHISSNRFPPGGCHIGCNQAEAAILHDPAENVFPTNVGTLESKYAGG